VSAARVEFTAEALREIDDAFEWYLERSLQAAEAFVSGAYLRQSVIYLKSISSYPISRNNPHMSGNGSPTTFV
jgi:hypothetical protein